MRTEEDFLVRPFARAVYQQLAPEFGMALLVPGSGDHEACRFTNLKFSDMNILSYVNFIRII